MKKNLLSFVIVFVAIVASEGAMFSFNGTDVGSLGEALDDEQGPVSYTVNGIEATFSTAVGDLMNAGAGDFGIDSGTGSTDDLDAFNVGEWLDITFDVDVTLTEMTVSSFGSGNQGVIYVNGISNGVISTTGSISFDVDILAGETLRIEGTGQTSETNGWSLDTMTVAVPEPMAASLIGIGGLLMVVTRKIRGV